MLRAFFAKLRDSRYNRAYQDGYSWAAGELLSCRSDPWELMANHDHPFNTGENRAFDKGVKAACYDWEKLVRGNW